MSNFAISRLGMTVITAACVLAPGVACIPEPEPCGPAEDDPGCTGYRWIAILDPNNPCPTDAQGIWTAAKLFKGPVGGPPPSLGRYCLYEWTGLRVNPGGTQCLPYGANGPGDDEINRLQTVIGPSAELGEDCIDTAPLAFEDDAAAWARKSLFVRAGGVEPLPSMPTTPLAARIVAADTSPDALDGGIAVGKSRHGDTVAHIARDLACPGGEMQPCAAHVTTALGLPRFDLANPLSTDLVQGGFFGTEGDLAQSIERLVLAWRDEIIKGPGDPRLIVNLSVGWENDVERDNCAPPNWATNPEVLSPPARAVLDSMRYATCHGALILAAAGNDTGGVEPNTGLVCPARWEELAPLTRKQCEEWVGAEFAGVWNERWPNLPRRPMPGQLAYDRIVYAVGGVDQGDEPLVPTRPLARPRIAALGVFAAAWDDSANGAVTPNANGQPVDVPPFLTGTSISTAVASAVAASVWAYDPTRTAPEVLDVIYQSGVALQHNGVNITADTGTCIGASAAACNVRRLSLCKAIGAPCGDAAPVGAQNQVLQNPALPMQLDATLVTEYASATALTATFPDNLPIPHARSATAAASPWTFPQPNWPTCPACVAKIASPNELVLFAKPGVDMSDLSLVIVDPQGVVRSARVAGAVQRNGPVRITVTSQNGFAATNVRRVWLSGTSSSQTGTTVSVVEQIPMTGL